MSQPAELAAGESSLIAFCEAWDEHCKQQGLAWTAPKIVVEDGAAVARFDSYRVSVRLLSGCKRLQAAFAWCTAEAESHWCPVVWCEEDAIAFCARLADVLDRRIPW